MTDISEQKFDPDRLKKAHRLMEWSNIIVIACAALGATAWFTSYLVLFYVLGSIALILTLLFMWGTGFHWHFGYRGGENRQRNPFHRHRYPDNAPVLGRTHFGRLLLRSVQHASAGGGDVQDETEGEAK